MGDVQGSHSAAIYNNHKGVTSASKASASSDSNASFIGMPFAKTYIFSLLQIGCESGTRGGGDDDAGDEARPASPVPV